MEKKKWEVTQSNGDLRSVESHLTQEEAISLLKASSSSFGKDLVHQLEVKGSLTTKQLSWLNILAYEVWERVNCERLRAEEERKALSSQMVAIVQDEREMDGVFALFRKMSDKLILPTIRLATEAKEIYSLFLAGAGEKHEGSILIKAPYPLKVIGRLSSDGLFLPFKGGDYTKIVDLLVDLVRSPSEALRKFGKLTGLCSLCGKRLTDPPSLEAGWGPVCARNWGLEHGRVKRKKVEQEEQESEELPTSLPDSPLHTARLKKAALAFIEYDLGDSHILIKTGGWVLTRNVYSMFVLLKDKQGGQEEKIDFNVRFKDHSDEVEDFWLG